MRKKVKKNIDTVLALNWFIFKYEYLLRVRAITRRKHKDKITRNVFIGKTYLSFYILRLILKNSPIKYALHALYFLCNHLFLQQIINIHRLSITPIVLRKNEYEMSISYK